MAIDEREPEKEGDEVNPFLSKALVSFRWTSFFPVALIAMLCSLLLFGVVIRVAAKAGEGLKLIAIILNGGVSVAIFVWVGALIAPKGRFQVAVAFTILFAVIAAITIYAKAMNLAVSGTVLEICAGFLSAGIAAILVCVYWYRREKING
jgi:hypothetical protein